MKRFALLLSILLVLALSGYYYVYMKPRFELWLAEMFPGAEISCSYVVPVPFASRVYVGNVQVFRKGNASGQGELFFYCDSLVHYKGSRITVRDGTTRSGLVLEANNFAARMAGISFSANKFAVEWHTDSTPEVASSDAAGENLEEVIFSRLDASGLEAEIFQQHTFAANALHVVAYAFRPAEWQGGAAAFQEAPWLFLLRKHISLGKLSLLGLEVPGTAESKQTFFSKITLEDVSGGSKGLDFQFHALSELLGPVKDGQDRGELGVSPGTMQDYLSRLSAIGIGASIPWAGEGDGEEAMADVSMKLSLPLITDVEFSGETAAPSVSEAAAWLASCAHYAPPFMEEPSRSLRNVGFDQLTVSITDQGVLEKLNNFYSGAGSLLFLLDYEGRYGFASAFFALEHMVFEQVELSPGQVVGAIVRDISGKIYPFRDNLVKRFLRGNVVLEAAEGSKLTNFATLDFDVMPSVEDQSLPEDSLVEDVAPPAITTLPVEIPQGRKAPPVQNASLVEPPVSVPLVPVEAVPPPGATITDEEVSPVPAVQTPPVTADEGDKDVVPQQHVTEKKNKARPAKKTPSQGSPLQVVAPEERLPQKKVPAPLPEAFSDGQFPRSNTGSEENGGWVRLW
jgi:hypothetical protein